MLLRSSFFLLLSLAPVGFSAVIYNGGGYPNGAGRQSAMARNCYAEEITSYLSTFKKSPIPFSNYKAFASDYKRGALLHLREHCVVQLRNPAGHIIEAEFHCTGHNGTYSDPKTGATGPAYVCDYNRSRYGSELVLRVYDVKKPSVTYVREFGINGLPPPPAPFARGGY